MMWPPYMGEALGKYLEEVSKERGSVPFWWLTSEAEMVFGAKPNDLVLIYLSLDESKREIAHRRIPANATEVKATEMQLATLSNFSEEQQMAIRTETDEEWKYGVGLQLKPVNGKLVLAIGD